MGKEWSKTIKAVLLLVILVSYKLSVTIFVHTHNVDGIMVAHSHPFTNGNHTHSSSQILVIGQLSTFNGVEYDSVGELKVYYNGVEDVLFTTQNLNEIVASATVISLRAPPESC